MGLFVSALVSDFHRSLEQIGYRQHDPCSRDRLPLNSYSDFGLPKLTTTLGTLGIFLGGLDLFYFFM
jgi:hypothetical protein